MKRTILNTLRLLAIAAGASIMGSCEEEQPVITQVDYTIEAKKIADVSATVSVNASEEECIYFVHCFTKTEFDAASESIQETMTTLSSDPEYSEYIFTSSKDITFEGLEIETEYVICLLPLDKGTTNSVMKCDIRTTAKMLPITYAQLYYYGNYYFNGTDNFMFELGNVSYEENGKLIPPGERIVVSIIIEPKNMDHPAADEFIGSYYFDETTQPGDIGKVEPMVTYLYVYTENNENEIGFDEDVISFKEFKIDFSKASDDYIIKGEYTDQNGERRAFYFEGEISYSDKAFYGYTGPQLDHDITLEGSTYIKYANYYSPASTDELANYQISIMFDEDHEPPYYEKDHLNLMLYLPKEGDFEHFMLDGTYQICEDAPEKGGVQSGAYMQIGAGMFGSEGSYYWNNSSDYDIGQTMGFLKSGTVTIKNGENGKVTIEVDAVTDLGHKVTAYYDDVLELGQW